MSSFYIFNIQLLKSKDGITEEAGEARYLQLFNSLGLRQKKIISEKKILNDAFQLKNNGYFIPTFANQEVFEYFLFRRKVKKNVIVGSFEKFNEASEVQEYYSKAVLFSKDEDQTAISNRFEFAFLFDPVAHWLAIEDTLGKLPGLVTMEKILNRYLSPIASKLFDDYSLQINLVSKQDTLQEVIATAVGFKRIHAELTFKNGPTANQVLNKMADDRLHKLDMTVSAAKDDVMPRVPDVMQGVLENTSLYGKSEITYIDGTGGKRRVAKFNSLENPEKISARRKMDEGIFDYLGRISKSLITLATRRGHVE